jgi:UDP-N-acetylmuramoylalanine--D-glutamate ligase
LWWKEGDKQSQVVRAPGFAQEWGMHNVANLAASALAAHSVGVSWGIIESRIATLPTVAYRQELVHRSAKLTIINDTTATSPEGGMAAIRRFSGPNMVLLCGGTDRELNYTEWARLVRTHVNRNNLIFLAGSATKKMCAALGAWRRGIRVYETLEDAFHAALRRAREYGHGVVVFSPAAKSFELFANEFDRGQQFNVLVRRQEHKKQKR